MRQKFFDLLGGLAGGQMGEDVFEIGMRFQSVAAGCLDDAVKHGAGFGAADTVTEQPVFSANSKRPDSAFSKVVGVGKGFATRS